MPPSSYKLHDAANLPFSVAFLPTTFMMQPFTLFPPPLWWCSSHSTLSYAAALFNTLWCTSHLLHSLMLQQPSCHIRLSWSHLLHSLMLQQPSCYTLMLQSSSTLSELQQTSCHTLMLQPSFTLSDAPATTLTHSLMLQPPSTLSDAAAAIFPHCRLLSFSLTVRWSSST